MVSDLQYVDQPLDNTGYAGEKGLKKVQFYSVLIDFTCCELADLYKRPSVTSKSPQKLRERKQAPERNNRCVDFTTVIAVFSLHELPNCIYSIKSGT